MPAATRMRSHVAHWWFDVVSEDGLDAFIRDLSRFYEDQLKMSLRGRFRGWLGEVKTSLVQRLLLDRATYSSFNNIVVPTSRGSAQIDHVVVSRYGVFVVETKSRFGWIYGAEADQFWTHVRFRKKDRFPNPLHQNFGHMKALEESLGLPLSKMHSVVVFNGGCELKTALPANVITKGYAAYIKSKTAVLLTDEEVQRATAALQVLKASTGRSSLKAHVAQVKSRYSDRENCPKCRSPLVQRVAGRGPKRGSAFMGCSDYPRCKFTRPL